jgi:hypothetical protein
MATAAASWTGREAWLHFTPLDSRLSAGLQAQGYQVRDLVADRPLFALEFNARARVDTGALPATAAAIREVIRIATIQATGYPPTAVGVTSAGEPAPSVVDSPLPVSWLTQLATQLGTSVQVVLWILVAGIGLLVFTIARNPALVAG